MCILNFAFNYAQGKRCVVCVCVRVCVRVPNKCVTSSVVSTFFYDTVLVVLHSSCERGSNEVCAVHTRTSLLLASCMIENH